MDPCVTGNKQKKLSTAEQLIYAAMKGDDDSEPNPILNRIPGNGVYLINFLIIIGIINNFYRKS